MASSVEPSSVEPFIREAGNGPGVVCIHSNASSSSQWRSLMDLLAPRHQVLAPDSYGSGKSPDWHSDRVISLADEVALIEPVLTRATAPLVLVGHSYGGSVALKAALMHPARVRALVLYEPTLFAVLEAEKPSPNQADGIRHAVSAAAEALDRNDLDAAAEAFIDYWMGAGAWAATPEQRKPAIAASVGNVRRWAHALMTEPTPLAAFAALKVPVLYMLGGRSPESAHGVARLLVPALPQAEVLTFDKLGHMGPITHPDVVNAAIASFLDRL
ncbi:alpha/beta hydrolase [Polaromonas sp. YR568]|uniref:alpha/beta fold hydrolase n=1 Tax=Polaromonas sp. YR568 TaxID=1855301 RepID=UPI003137A28B